MNGVASSWDDNGNFTSDGLYYVHGRWYVPDWGMYLSPNEKGDYLFGGDGQDPVNFTWEGKNSGASAASKNATTDIPPLNNPNCDLTALNCSIEQMEQLQIATRIRWMHDFQITYQTQGWFNNVEGILQIFQDEQLVHPSHPAENPNYPGSYFSWVDAYILDAIQDGESRQRDGIPSPGGNIAGPEWKTFFSDFAVNQRQVQILKQDWGGAEQAATDNGRLLATQMHADIGPWGTALAGWYAFDFVGDLYRKVNKIPNGGGKLVGAFFGTLCMGNEDCGTQGFNLGEYLTDPRSQAGNSTPSAIVGRAFYTANYSDLNIGTYLNLLYGLVPK